MVQFSLESFRRQLNTAAAGDEKATTICNKVVTETAKFLTKHSFASDSVSALENLVGTDTIPKVNADAAILGNVSASDIRAYVESCGVAPAHVDSVATECARILSGNINRLAIFEDTPSTEGQMSLESIVGSSAMSGLRHDARHAMEAFGGDIDRLQQDNRLNIIMAVLRSFTSVVDKVLPRVAEASNVVTIKTPAPEVYDLARSMNASGSVRNAASNRLPLVSLFKEPDAVSTQPQAIIPNHANDTDTVPSILAGGYDAQALTAGKQINLLDLTSSATRIGYNGSDFTDLVAEGGAIRTIFIRATHTDSSKVTTEDFAVPVRYLPTAVLTQSANANDSGDVNASVRAVFAVRPGRLMANGKASVLFASYTDAVVKLDVTLHADLNLKTFLIQGDGSVSSTLIPAAGKTEVGPTTKADVAKIAWSVIGYAPDLYFDEENMRKTTTAVRVNYLQRQFVIPMGRNFVVDFALQQENDDNAASTVTVVAALGNSVRGMDIIESRLSDISSQLAFMTEYSELSGDNGIDPRNMSVAASLCLPYVVRGNLNYSDMKTAVMRETERLSDMHARLREMLLNSLATVCAKSLYLNNLEAGEKPVFKVITHSVIADLIFGIVDYHNELNDVVPVATGVDYSMELPNGYRIDVAKTNFTKYEGKILVFPVRENNPTHVTSFGTIRDRGSYTAQYTPLNGQGVARRIVTNTREIVMPTNPVGAIITVTGLDAELGSTAPAASA